MCCFCLCAQPLKAPTLVSSGGPLWSRWSSLGWPLVNCTTSNAKWGPHLSSSWAMSRFPSHTLSYLLAVVISHFSPVVPSFLRYCCRSPALTAPSSTEEFRPHVRTHTLTCPIPPSFSVQNLPCKARLDLPPCPQKQPQQSSIAAGLPGN